MKQNVRVINSYDNRFATLPVNGSYDEKFELANKNTNMLSLMMINNSMYNEGVRLAQSISGSDVGNKTALNFNDISSIMKVLQIKSNDLETETSFKLDLGNDLIMDQSDYLVMTSNVNKIINLLSMVLGICKVLFNKGKFAQIASNIQKILNIISSGMTTVEDVNKLVFKQEDVGVNDIIKTIGKEAIINAIPVDESVKMMVNNFL